MITSDLGDKKTKTPFLLLERSPEIERMRNKRRCKTAKGQNLEREHPFQERQKGKPNPHVLKKRLSSKTHFKVVFQSGL